ncbi:hypothetical protein QFC21_007253 [Naganishia friedmannii]|uniref:Uncharacterized protein n=1 Tax=Naganishia friedmannii TaxID=89922 RepID=A0ACC2UWB8_9TREE|nr:hypothetical protein QFC21_007253 [Naganishia friedmannii]
MNKVTCGPPDSDGEDGESLDPTVSSAARNIWVHEASTREELRKEIAAAQKAKQALEKKKQAAGKKMSNGEAALVSAVASELDKSGGSGNVL